MGHNVSSAKKSVKNPLPELIADAMEKRAAKFAAAAAAKDAAKDKIGMNIIDGFESRLDAINLSDLSPAARAQIKADKAILDAIEGRL
jgi:hypothetical protein